MDTAIGTGSFYSALLHVFPITRINAAVGYEIDPHYDRFAARLWGETKLDIRLEDFTQAEAPGIAEKFNLLVCSPPYERHHHIASGEKQRLQLCTQNTCGGGYQRASGSVLLFPGLKPSVDGRWRVSPQTMLEEDRVNGADYTS